MDVEHPWRCVAAQTATAPLAGQTRLADRRRVPHRCSPPKRRAVENEASGGAAANYGRCGIAGAPVAGAARSTLGEVLWTQL